ncbi:MAG: Na+/H+ antiporter subunit E [Campylobacterota bacterium]|nr:Na+/H+ antiporter subunit E [Campylobacterota bacterium]
MRIFYWTILLFVLWLVLSASLHVENILVGAVISSLVALTYTKIFKQEKFEPINPLWLSVYFLILIKNLITSNISIAKRVFSKDMKLSPAIVAVKTELTSDWKKLLLANSITLTPGTLTLDVVDDTLYIHIIECENIINKQKITEEFENIIAKM